MYVYMYVCMYVFMWLNWLECDAGHWKHLGPLGQKFKCRRATYMSSLGQGTNVQFAFLRSSSVQAVSNLGPKGSCNKTKNMYVCMDVCTY